MLAFYIIADITYALAYYIVSHYVKAVLLECSFMFVNYNCMK
jgi:hypothetical protein